MATFVTYLGCSILEIKKKLDSTIFLTAIRWHEWEEVQHTTLSEKINRTINALGATLFHHNTRFTKEESQMLFELFGKLDGMSHVRMSYRFTYEDTLLIALQRQSNGIDYHQLDSTYGGDWTKFSYVCALFSTFNYHKFYHRLCGRCLEYWVPSFHTHRKDIWRHVCFDA